MIVVTRTMMTDAENASWPTSLLFFLPAPVEIMAHGVHRELHTARHAELVQDHRKLVFDRLRTEAQPRGDFTVRSALDDEGDDLVFALGQCRRWLLHACNPIWQSWSRA
jgi:hypothetical protein